jgi:branched-chain amino acid transport system ATP-binding protein
MGLTPPRYGSIIYQGTDITKTKTFEVCRAGIAYVPEDRRIFSTLTLLENLSIGAQKHRQNKINLERILNVFPVLAARKHHRGHELSGGEQQMLAIARALMGNPFLLLLDEPMEGLAPLIVELLIDTIAQIKHENITIILVEQDLESAFKVADRHYILEQGKVVHHAPNEDLKTNKEVIERYLSV